MNSSLSKIWTQSLTLWLPVLKKAWGWLLFSMLIEEAFTYWIGSMSRSDERLYIIGAVMALFFQLILSAIGIVIVNQMVFDVMTNKKMGIFESLQKNLKYVFIESTRAILPVLLKALLFIIPG